MNVDIEWIWYIDYFDEEYINSLPRPTTVEEKNVLFLNGRHYIEEISDNGQEFYCKKCKKMFPDKDILIAFKDYFGELAHVYITEEIIHEHTHFKKGEF